MCPNKEPNSLFASTRPRVMAPMSRSRAALACRGRGSVNLLEEGPGQDLPLVAGDLPSRGVGRVPGARATGNGPPRCPSPARAEGRLVGGHRALGDRTGATRFQPVLAP